MGTVGKDTLVMGGQGTPYRPEAYLSLPFPQLYLSITGPPSPAQLPSVESDSILSGQYMLKLTDMNGLSLVSTGGIVVTYEHLALKISLKKQLKPAIGMYNLDEYFEVTGPLQSMKIKGADSEKVMFYPRMQLSGEIKGDCLIELLSYSQGWLFSLSYSPDQHWGGTLTLKIYLEEQLQTTIQHPSFGKPASMDSHVMPNGDSVLFVCLPDTPDSLTYSISLFHIQQGKLLSSNYIIRGHSESIEAVMIKDTLVIMARFGQDINMYSVNYTRDGFLPFVTQHAVISGLRDASAVVQSERIVMVGFARKDNSYRVLTYTLGDLSNPQSNRTLFPARRFRKQSISCKEYKTTQVVCAVNTFSTYVVELYVDIFTFSARWYFHNKFGNHDIRNVDVENDYVVAVGISKIQGKTGSPIIQVWRSGEGRKSSKIYSLVLLNCTTNVPVQYTRKVPLDIRQRSSSNDKEPILVIAAGTLDPGRPMLFFEVRSPRLSILNTTNLNLSEISVEFVGVNTTNHTLQHLLSGSAHIDIENKPSFLNSDFKKFGLFVVAFSGLIILGVVLLRNNPCRESDEKVRRRIEQDFLGDELDPADTIMGGVETSRDGPADSNGRTF